MVADENGQGSILVVDDDAAVVWALERSLTRAGYRVVVAADAGTALKRILKQRPDLVITDVRMPGMSGLDLLATVRAEHPGLPVVVMTAYGTIDTAMAAVQQGAADYLIKPLDLERLLPVVTRVLGDRRLAMRIIPETAEAHPEPALLGTCQAMQEVFRRLAAAALSESCVLFSGPGGTGKALAARILHERGHRRTGPLVRFDCQSLPEDIGEADMAARVEVALAQSGPERSPGILLLQEVAELPLAGQAWLLRSLADPGTGSVRIGGCDLRVVATTCRELDQLAAQGDYRPDLLGRLRVISIALPPLSARQDDLPLLVRHILKRVAIRGRRTLALTEDALTAILAHAWPGNVRELASRLEEAAAFAHDGIIDRDHIQLPHTTQVDPAWHAMIVWLARNDLKDHPGEAHRRFCERMETVILQEAMAQTGGNQLRAAELLGLNRLTLRRHLDRAAAGPPG